MTRNIGVLALQGDFDKHKTALLNAGVNVTEIRMPKHLKGCDGLVIPGGESTTLTKLLSLYSFYDPLINFAKKFPIMGTCAGLIMLSTDVDDDKIKPLKLIDIKASRNAYGRQIDSFIAPIEFNGIGSRKFDAYFIRAPKIEKTGGSITIIGKYKNNPVAVANNNILAMSFHPELGNDFRIHKMFIEKFC